MPATEIENESPRFSDLQRRAYRALNEDGIVDIALGLGLLFAALYIGLDHLAGVKVTGWSGLFPIFVMLIARGLRKRYVYPRIGYARIRHVSPAIVLMVALMLLLIAGIVVLGIFARRGTQPPGTLIAWCLRLFALTGAGTLALMGRRTGFARFYIHAGVIVTAVFVSVAVPDLHYGLLLMFGLPGIFLFASGIACFSLFLRRHPKPEVTGANA